MKTKTSYLVNNYICPTQEMIKKDSSLFINAMNMGALTGLVISAIQLILYSFGLGESSGFQWILYMVLIFAISWGSRQYRDKAKDGFINYSQSLGFGTALAFGAALVFGFFNYIWLKYVDPEFIEVILENMEIAFYESESMDDDQIEMIMGVYRSFLGPGMFAFGLLINYTFIGFIGSLIMSIFIKNPKSVFE